MKLQNAESMSSSGKETPSTSILSARSESISPKQPDKVAAKEPNDGINEREDGDEYVTGVKLTLILVSTTVVYFLMMLDMSILATVGFCLWLHPSKLGNAR